MQIPKDHRIFFFALIWIVGVHTAALYGQTGYPYLVRTGSQLELVGFPVHHPAIDTGTVLSVSGKNLVHWRPSFQAQPFGLSLPPSQEYYAEVVGPPTHPWLGHRLELDEASTRLRRDHRLVVANSAWNTRGLPNSSLAKAQLEVRQHLTIDQLWGEEIKRRTLYGQESPEAILFAVPTMAGLRSVKPALTGNTLQWQNASRPSGSGGESLLLPPGSSVGVDFGETRGSALGFTGVHRTWRTAAPLQAGFNLLAYPYPQDLHLGQDWGGSRDGFAGSTQPSGQQDHLELVDGNSRLLYSPETQGGGKLRWRQLQPGTKSIWSTPPAYLDRIPVGQGFLLWKSQAVPGHFFYPPKP